MVDPRGWTLAYTDTTPRLAAALMACSMAAVTPMAMYVTLAPRPSESRLTAST